ncbi:hypothetical protein CK203_054684 [Vitis vinifera]|uniref:Uncharacterized protein n=1 Tax=Vitis vinifera TaxID=29760 RepID=A0A438H8Y6_VITVI|nr:hypothetical protein CK203_054684 [Vitis vinifera]
MVCINSNSFLLLATFILISSSFSPRCHGENTQFPHRHAMHSEGMTDLGGHGVVFLETGRSVLENGDSERNPSLILAAKRTKRIDPLHHFKHYKGGWNISNRNYFSSVGFTAAPLFLISAFWFLGFGIVGCVVLYTGQGKFHSSTTTKQLGVDQYFMPSNVQANIDNIQIKINASTTFLEEKKIAIQIEYNIVVYGYVLQTASINYNCCCNAPLVPRWFLLLCSQPAASRITFWQPLHGFSLRAHLSCVAYFFFSTSKAVNKIRAIVIVFRPKAIIRTVSSLHSSVAADTCVAMNEWSKDVTFQLVNVVNNFITNVSNKNLPTQAKLEPSVSYNQTGPLVPVLCNPYQPNKTRRVVKLEWNKYICEVSADGICTTPGRLTPKLYNQMSTAANVSSALYHHGPFLVDLQDCSFVQRIFTDIIKDHCPGLRRYSEWICIGLTMVSSAVLLSSIIWISYTRLKRGKEYIRQYADMPTQDSLELQKGMK